MRRFLAWLKAWISSGLVTPVMYGPIAVDPAFVERHKGMHVAFCAINHDPVAISHDVDELSEMVAREFPGRHLVLVTL
jgi:hypothetical protein